MPELPEVETIRRGLERRIVGKTIADIEVKFPKIFVGKKSEVEGLKIEKVERRAKVLALNLKKGKNLLFHLKMTGQLIYRSGGTWNVERGTGTEQKQFAGGHPSHDWHLPLPNATTAIIFSFNDGSKLYFNDLRRFGWCKVLDDKELQKIFDEEYGPEPIRLADARSHSSLSDEAQTSESKTGQALFNVDYLMQQAARFPNRKIKQFLMDQHIIAGVGNIYADESLFAAKISPLRKAKDISKTEWEKIIVNVRTILKFAIEHGGTTDSDYVNADGEKGGMQDYLKVYRKAGEKCPGGCGGKIVRITVGGRGTHYCPDCQK